jgi:hypothetical protein
MNDRELLELAAKAAGYDYECTALTGYPEHDQHQIRNEFGTLVDWNPLADDGDALRLAVKIGKRDYFGIEIQKGCTQATSFEPWEHCEYEDHNKDPYAATRRAIVRAAAETGKPT